MGVAKKIIDKKALRDFVPINALSAVHLEEVSRKAVITDVRAGRYAFKKGDRDSQSVYLIEGKIDLIADNGDVVGQVKAGSEAARHPLAHKQPRHLSARAVGNVTIACIDSNLLDVLLTWDESAGYDVVEIDAQDDDDWMTRMLQSQAFLQLPPSNIHQLLMRLETVSVAAGDVIVRQGDEGDYFYIVKSGRMKVTRKASPRGKEVVLAELGEGACFGEEALVSDAERNASVTMITDGDLMRLSKQDFRELLCTPLVHEINFAEAREIASTGARWLDVRLPGEFDNQAIKGSSNLPLSALRDASSQLDSSATYIVCCDTGRRSAAGAFILGQRGFRVYTLKKGLMGVPEEMLTAAPGSAMAECAQRDVEAEIIPFEKENRDNPGAENAAPRVQELDQALREARERLAELDAQRNEERAISERVMLKVESLERDLQQLRGEREALEERLRNAAESGDSKNSELGEQVARLVGEKQEREKRTLELEQDLARVREDYRQLGQRASALGGERDAAVRDLEKLRVEIGALKQQLSSGQGEANERLEALEVSLEQRTREVEEEKSQRRFLEQQLEDRITAHQALEREIDALRRHAEVQTAGSEALASDLDGVRSRAEELETQLAAATEREQALQADVENLENAAREALDRARTEISAEKGALDQRVADMQAQLEDKARRLEDALSRQHELEQSIAQAAQEHEAAKQEGQAQLQEALQVSEHAAEQLRSEARSAQDALDRQIAELQSRLEEGARLLEEEKSRNSEVQRKFAELEQDHDALSGREQTMQADLHQREQQLEELRKSLDTATQKAGEFEHQLTESRQGAAAAEKQVTELESRLKALNKDHESDIASVRGALARAQDERENVMRDQKRLMESLRKAENALVQARQDHEAEVYRLRKELKESAGEASSGLAAELEALQKQLKEQVQQREELEVRLGSRSEQLENAQVQVERLSQQLDQAQHSAREAEQQLVEANEAADQEMTIRLQAEQETQQGLRDELARVVLERNEHQERVTVLVQEAEELRNALTTQEADRAAATDSRRQLDELREQLQRLEQERDELRESGLRMQQEADRLRAETEVTRGLVNMAPAGDGDVSVREELVAVKKNVEVAVRLRSQAEAQVVALEQTVSRLEAELDRARTQSADGSATVARIPSLDENDPQASAVLNVDFEEPEEDNGVAATGVLLETDSAPGDEVRQNALSDSSQKRGGAWKSIFAGLLIGGLAVGAGVWWLGQQPDSTTLPAKRSAAETEQEVTPPIVAESPTVAAPETAAAKSESRPVPPVAWGLPVPEPASPSANATAAPEPVNGDSGSEHSEARPTERNATDVAAPARQPAGYFRDRLSSGASAPAMVELNAGAFLMGSGPASPNFDERPRHEVQLKRFAISRYETTFDEYDRFALDTGRARPSDSGWGRGKRPVTNVSWQDANAYAQWLSRQTGHRYRLPSEAEWEFAARSGSNTRFWWGNEVGEARASCFDCGAAKAGQSTLPVGSFDSSSYGVYDMAGNVREWVSDCYAPNYTQAHADGGAVDSQGCSERVVRGGGFSSPSDKLRSTARDASAPQSRLNDLGFRVVREY